MNSKRRSPFLHSIRFQLLVAVNVVVFLMLAALLSFDYQRELAAHFGEKKFALKDEARTLLPSVIHLQRHGRDAIQEYVDYVCGRMEDADSPGHHIAVEIGGDLIQANSHHRASTDLGSTMKAATTKGGNQILHENQELIVGTQSHGDTSVYVSENVTRLGMSFSWMG